MDGEVSNLASPQIDARQEAPPTGGGSGPVNDVGLRSARRTGQKILIVSNCQTFGVVNCLRAMTSSVSVDGVLVHETLGKDDAYFSELIGRYDHVVATIDLRAQVESPSYRDKMSYLPTVFFDAYHPDMIQMRYRGSNLGSPLGGYHSAIVVGAYTAGLSVGQTVEMFNANTYRALGFRQRWDVAKSKLLDDFRVVGFERLEDQFYLWPAKQGFMLSANHPRIHVLSCIATEIARQIGVSVERDCSNVPDNLLNGAICPVYPEIAEDYGFLGDYYFKPPGTTYTLSLEEFVAANFEDYDKISIADIWMHAPYREKVDAVVRLVS